MLALRVIHGGIYFYGIPDSMEYTKIDKKS